ncbi:uncharacterized protein TNCT_537281 [Trichonephila clavata]|uniref:Uncharacterized protein n=1 Tax=Trichonephila clavata TaxID=2740835 RepID=A0A8X6LWC8_TRICU|nr:uncharacterized protein TNCT_537281 [Trichonephila clavata]
MPVDIHPHRPPDVNVIRRLDDRLRNTGSVWPTANLRDTGIPQSGLTVAQADAILHLVEETPEVSTRAPVREMTSTKSTVHRLLRSERLYPFRYTAVQGWGYICILYIIALYFMDRGNGSCY